MKSILKYILVIMVFSCKYNYVGAQAQPPSLQMGLTGLTFQPGTLDAELIMEIITEKQEEIKKQAIKNLILRQVDNRGGTIYIFADNVLNAIVNEKDNTIRTRTILENTVNLVFSMVMNEYIRRLERQKIDSILLPRVTIKKKAIGVPQIYNASQSFQTTLDTNTNRNRTFLYTLDIVSEAIRTNKRLNALGLMRITYPGEWNALNQYINDQDSVRKAIANRIKVQVDMRLEQLLNNIGFITDQLTVSNFSYPSNSNFVLRGSKNNFLDKQFSQKIAQAINTTNLLLTDTTAQYRRFRMTHGDALSEYWSYLQKINQVDARTLTLHQMSDIMYHLTVDVIPRFEQIGDFVPGVSDLFQQTIDVQKLIRTGTKPDTLSADNSSLMRLVAKLYQFKKAKTYSDYLNIMTDLPALVGDQQVHSTLNTLLAFIKNYVTIRQDIGQPEVVSIDIESLLAMLEHYSQNRPKTIQFLFTVGANTAYRSGAVGDSVRNFAFVGEKIGLKVKLKDWSYLRSFNKYQTFYRHAGSRQTVTKLYPPQEPIVSNMHLLLYGSGILYNLVKSSNNTSFRNPLIGLGIGVTFVNSLDLTLSMNFPQRSNSNFSENFSRPFFNLGFDILFLEYLDRLVKKRKVASK